MKPRGLTNAHQPDVKPYAVAQLRQDNALGTLFNMVGFQTKLKYAGQTDVFRLIPGLEEARFARLGGLHRNTFLNSPTLLAGDLSLKTRPDIRFAGQITGVEGYVESTAIGLLAGRFAAAELMQTPLPAPPPTTAFGSLLAHITVNAEAGTFQPMNMNFGLMPLPDTTGAEEAPRNADGKTARQGAHARAKTEPATCLHTPRANRFCALADRDKYVARRRIVRFFLETPTGAVAFDGVITTPAWAKLAQSARLVQLSKKPATALPARGVGSH